MPAHLFCGSQTFSFPRSLCGARGSGADVFLHIINPTPFIPSFGKILKSANRGWTIPNAPLASFEIIAWFFSFRLLVGLISDRFSAVHPGFPDLLGHGVPFRERWVR